MKEIKYFKTENIIEDTCIMYGVTSILKDNEIEFELVRQKSGYLLRHDDFDELIYTEYSTGDINNANGTQRADEVRNYIVGMNEWINNNIKDILTMVDSKSNYKSKSCGAMGMGNNFYTYSMGAGIKIEEFRRHLSFLGYLKYSALVKYGDSGKGNDDMDLLLIPREYSVITNIINLRNNKVDDEGNLKDKCYYYPNHSNIEAESLIYLNTLLKLKRNRDDYEEVYICRNMRNDKKNSKDTFNTISVKDWSIDLCEFFNRMIFFKKNNVNISDITAKFIVNSNINNFNKLIECYSKEINKNTGNTQLINIEIGKEIINMYSEKVKGIYHSQGVQEIGKRLKNLLQHKKGYEILTSLYSVANEKKMMNVISNIIDTYDRERNKNDIKYKYYYSGINDTQILEILDLLNDKEDAKIMSRAIISYSKVFFTKLDKTIDATEIQENIESQNNESEEV